MSGQDKVVGFKLPPPNKSARHKEIYAGNHQLAHQFSKLNSVLGDEYERDIVIGHGLIYALFNYEPSKSVKSSQDDQVRLYYDILHTVSFGLNSEKLTLDEAVWGLQNHVNYLLKEQNSCDAKQCSLLTFLFNETNLLNSVNPSDFLQKGANNLYSIVRQKGTLKGNRVIIGENYSAIQKAFRNL